jgi:hypothetical protein
MKSVAREAAVPDEPSQEASSPSGDSAIRPARDGLQPIRDLASFLRTLPDFGSDAVRLREVIAEDRLLRRAAAEGDDY